MGEGDGVYQDATRTQADGGYVYAYMELGNSYEIFWTYLTHFSSAILESVMSSFANFYISFLKIVGIEMMKVPNLGTNGSPTQSFSMFPFTKNFYGRPYDKFESPSDSVPSLPLGNRAANDVVRGDFGLIAAPQILTHRTVVSKVMTQEQSAALVHRFSRKPWSDYSPFEFFGSRFS